MLVIGGMFGGRWLATGAIDAIARKHGVRMIIPDKFGLGGTANVDLKYRVLGWLGKTRLQNVIFFLI